MSSGAGVTQGRLALTHRTVESLKPGQAPYRVCDERCIGLAVRVASNGIKTWDLSFRIRGAGKVRRVSLGRVTDVGLEQARERAGELTRAARAGRDLFEEERQHRATEAARLTVRDLIALYVRRRVTGQLRTAREIERRLFRALEPLLGKCAADLRRRDIRPILDEVADRGILREAEKRRQAIGAMFRWALGQDIVEQDPTAGLATYGRGAPRDRVLNEQEIVALWSWLHSSLLAPDPATIMQLQLLTGARCGEVSGICAEEIDCERWIWTLPAARSKNKKPRATPLLGEAKRIVSNRIAQTNRGPLFVTESGSPLKSVNVAQCLFARRRRLPIAAFTTHDLRRTVVTMLAEMGFGLDHVAATIGHEAGNRETRTLVRHYVRSDLLDAKARILTAWDHRIMRLIEGGDGNTIVPLRGNR